MSTHLRVGIVGCGGIARAHVSGYQQVGEAEIVAVIDPVEAAARQLADDTGADVAPSLAAMIEDYQLDAVSVCTPPSVHPETCLPFLDAGIAVLCEKPLAVDVTAAETFAKAVHEADAAFMVAFCHRFHPPVLELHRRLQAGELGKPLLFRNIFGGFVDMSANHRANPALSGGGPLIDHCSHSVDLFRYLFGEVEEVQAVGGNLLQEMAIEDFGTMHLVGAGPRFGEITGSYSLPVCGNWIEVYGSDATAIVSYWNAGHPDLAMRRRDDAEWQPIEINADVDRFGGEIRQFLACVRDGATPSVTVDDGLAANRITTGAYQSLQQGRRVKL